MGDEPSVRQRYYDNKPSVCQRYFDSNTICDQFCRFPEYGCLEDKI